MRRTPNRVTSTPAVTLPIAMPANANPLLTAPISVSVKPSLSFKKLTITD